MPTVYFVVPCYNEEEVLPETVKRIDSWAFWGTDLTDVYYLGTEAQWAQVLNEFDDPVEIEGATIHYLGTEKPSDDTSAQGQKSDGETGITDDTGDANATDAKNEDAKNDTGSPATGEAADTLPLLAMLASMGSMAVALILSKLRKLKGE